jgi:hypothetical protein
MRKFLLLVSTVVLGLTSVNSASAGFIAGPNTKVALLKSYYSNATGLVNKFAPSTPGTDAMVTTTGSFVTSPASTYSQLLGNDKRGYNVYLVAATGSPTPGFSNFGVTFTEGEEVAGVAASNGWKNFESGNMAANVWGSHIGLQSAVDAALQTLFPGNVAATNTLAATNVFGTGTQGIEIQKLGTTGNPDAYLKTLSSVSGTVYSTTFSGGAGLGELSLVFTVVPEPTSLGLFGIGALVFGFARSRRKQS